MWQASSTRFSCARRASSLTASFDRLAQAEWRRLEREPARLDLRHVEDVVDAPSSSASADVVRGAGGTRAARGVSRVSSASSVMPMIAFIGVRISWLMLARNSPFAAAAASAFPRSFSSSPTSCVR